LIGQEQIGSLFLMTTHSLPLNYLMESLGEFVPQVQMIGIQPDTVAFGYPMSAPVREAVERVYFWLKEGDNKGDGIELL
jgi:hydrogenase 3 maturation protease